MWRRATEDTEHGRTNDYAVPGPGCQSCCGREGEADGTHVTLGRCHMGAVRADRDDAGAPTPTTSMPAGSRGESGATHMTPHIWCAPTGVMPPGSREESGATPKGQATLCVQSAQYRMRSSEIALLRTVLVWPSTCIPYQLNIVSDYAITQYRTNASEIAHLVRIV